MQKMSRADMGDPQPNRGLPGSPRDLGHEKSKGKKMVTIPAPDSAVSGGSRPKNDGSRTSWEIVLENVSGALRARAATEHRRGEAGAGPGARFLFWT